MSLFACPETGAPLDPATWTTEDGDAFPLVDGVPVLVPDAARFLARHGPAWSVGDPAPTRARDPLPVDATDPVTPFLEPGDLGAPDSFGDWLRTLGGHSPAAVCAAWGDRLAPAGPAADLGCGVGPLTARMVAEDRPVVALDRSPRAVLLARAILEGRLREAFVPTHRLGLEARPLPVDPLPPGVVQWVVGDVHALPLADAAFAWVHLGHVLDITDGDPADVLFEAARCLAPGGLLTLSTPYDFDAPGLPDAVRPEVLLYTLLVDAGLEVVEEEERVPWVVREYDRGYRVLFSHCVAARRVATDD